MGQTNDRLWTWIESTWKDDDGTLYAAYHYEPDNLCFANHHLPTAPKIAWIRSLDNGLTWTDLGFVLAADPANIRCDTKSTWDSGGEGDFSAILDRKKEYFYFFFTSYDKEFKEQGIGVARMRYADRDNPSGKVWKWYNGQFGEPGVGGHFTPIFPAKKDWHEGSADIFWGPAIHWNTYLNGQCVGGEADGEIGEDRQRVVRQARLAASQRQVELDLRQKRVAGVIGLPLFILAMAWFNGPRNRRSGRRRIPLRCRKAERGDLSSRSRKTLRASG